jgi:PAS domain S-box-containing protein
VGILALGVRAMRRPRLSRVVADAQERRLAALFAASPVGIIEGRVDGTILAVNDALATMLDYSVDELMRMRASELAHPDCAADMSGAVRSLVDGSTSSYSSERVYRTRQGSPCPVLVSVVALREEGGPSAGWSPSSPTCVNSGPMPTPCGG